MKRAIATALVGVTALLTLAACPADDCDTPGATKQEGHGRIIYRCEKKIGESNYHWHRVNG